MPDMFDVFPVLAALITENDLYFSCWSWRLSGSDCISGAFQAIKRTAGPRG